MHTLLQYLKKMGGVQALGKGFTDYAHRKFNASQMTAISAAAQGYGDGNITLIKGPPGTGSKLQKPGAGAVANLQTLPMSNLVYLG